eukprot:TRINITY_DN3975_c0_g1_i3.p1 TRINITY_DN3975_c0_g1~~TRINITY_DN3975_c0_g1_i3.p1  ORF type:complete len:148 (+),score=28.42 TRINITY_DN3975_c0_g1_i3:116-559(+)
MQFLQQRLNTTDPNSYVTIPGATVQPAQLNQGQSQPNARTTAAFLNAKLLKAEKRYSINSKIAAFFTTILSFFIFFHCADLYGTGKLSLQSVDTEGKLLSIYYILTVFAGWICIVGNVKLFIDCCTKSEDSQSWHLRPYDCLPLQVF